MAEVEMLNGWTNKKKAALEAAASLVTHPAW